MILITETTSPDTRQHAPRPQDQPKIDSRPSQGGKEALWGVAERGKAPSGRPTARTYTRVAEYQMPEITGAKAMAFLCGLQRPHRRYTTGDEPSQANRKGKKTKPKNRPPGTKNKTDVSIWTICPSRF